MHFYASLMIGTFAWKGAVRASHDPPAVAKATSMSAAMRGGALLPLPHTRGNPVGRRSVQQMAVPPNRMNGATCAG